MTIPPLAASYYSNLDALAPAKPMPKKPAPVKLAPAPAAPAVVEPAAPSKPGAVTEALDWLGDAFMNLGGWIIGGIEVLTSWAFPIYSVTTYHEVMSDKLDRGSRMRGDAEWNKWCDEAIENGRPYTCIISFCLEATEDDAQVARLNKRIREINSSHPKNEQIPEIKVVHIPILDNEHPSMAQMKQMLDTIRDNPRTYIHCEAGQGRTGVGAACARMALENWSPERAIDESVNPPADSLHKAIKMPNQIAFLHRFAKALANGDITGYGGAS